MKFEKTEGTKSAVVNIYLIAEAACILNMFFQILNKLKHIALPDLSASIAFIISLEL